MPNNMIRGAWGKDFSVPYTGVTGQCASFAGNYVRFKNIGCSGSSGAVVCVGDDTPSFPLNDGDDTGWIPMQNMDKFFYSGQSATGTLHYAVIWD